MQNQSIFAGRKLNILLIILSGGLLIPALLIHLGINPLVAVNDEAIRILVALEMHLSGDYLTPTTFGEFYLRKPPLYNWLIIISSLINGEFSAFSLRIVSVISLLGFGFLVYHFTAKHYGRLNGASISLLVLSNGRLLFFDSFLGLIDIAHAAIIYWAFMLIYHYYHRKRFLLLFISSYLLIAIAFLMKGLPAVVFQGITLLVFFTYQKNFKKLMSLQHLAGIILFLLLTGTYYLLYLQKNELSFGDLFAVLFDQSAQRTGMELGFGKTILHIFSFPFEFIYHFAPWTLMLVLLWQKSILRRILNEPFLKYNAIIFFSNILIYWISPGVFARYFFMMIPLLFVAFTHFYFEEKEKDVPSRRLKIIEYSFLGMAALALIALPFIPFISSFANISSPWLKLAFPYLILLFVFMLMLKRPQHRLISMVVVLLCLRIVFNLFVLPERAEKQQKYADGAKKLAEISLGESLYIYSNNYLLQEADVFYIANTRNEVLTRKSENFSEKELYIIDDRQWDPKLFKELYQYPCKWYDRPIRLCRIKTAPIP